MPSANRLYPEGGQGGGERSGAGGARGQPRSFPRRSFPRRSFPRRAHPRGRGAGGAACSRWGRTRPAGPCPASPSAAPSRRGLVTSQRRASPPDQFPRAGTSRGAVT